MHVDLRQRHRLGSLVPVQRTMVNKLGARRRLER